MEWEKVIPVLVGGGISLLTTVVMFGVAQWVERRKRKTEKRAKDAFLAFTGFRKLVWALNEVENIRVQIDLAFKDDLNDHRPGAEPFEKVQPMLAAQSQVVSLSADELFFLAKRKQSSLISNIDLIVDRVRTDRMVLDKYSELRMELNKFMEDRVHPEGKNGDGPQRYELSAKDRVIFDSQAGSLNIMLSRLIEFVERDCSEGRQICDEYLTAAKSEFGEEFPAFTISKGFEHANP
jgi:hypothetical protein